MNKLQALKDLGVEIGHEQVWLGEAGTPERHSEDDLSTVSGVGLPLTEKEWCAIAMRDGAEYIGGCCGTTGAMQEIINGAFRDSGWIGGADLLTLGSYAASHDGFDEFDRSMDDQTFAAGIASWADLGPWAKIGLLYQAVEPLLKPRSYELPRVDEKPEEQRCVRLLERALVALSWDDLVSSDDPGQQRHANRIVLMSRALVPAQQFLGRLEQSVEVFEGVAIVEKGTDNVLTNMAGLCLYDTAEEAKRVIEIWQRNDDEAAVAKAEIKPVRVTVAGGVEVAR